jgi:2-C-methyl-D-erythritol 2,4-cyclodiphosphate synthase
MIRAGIGIDFNRFAANRKLILGGVEIAYRLGLAGHSDADVLTHAICDALLGAAGLGDIGRWFPDPDPQWKDISSLILLQRVREMLGKRGWRVGNVDATIIAEQPRLAPYIPEMGARLAEVLQADEKQINIKVTTPEGMGSLGRGEGLAAWAVATLAAADQP